jgi:hypothetical protein
MHQLRLYGIWVVIRIYVRVYVCNACASQTIWLVTCMYARVHVYVRICMREHHYDSFSPKRCICGLVEHGFGVLNLPFSCQAHECVRGSLY